MGADHYFDVKIAYPHHQFQLPVYISHIPDGSNRMVVIEQSGKIFSFSNDPQEKTSDLILDLTDRVRQHHMEEGLLGLAFHPEYKKNRFMYVFYSASKPKRVVISRFKKFRFKNQFNKKSEHLILEVAQPYGNHNGGMIEFGPDGYLYISLGDGGAAGDPDAHAQNLQSLLGKILRIDVNHAENSNQYSIPPDNPFANLQEAEPEIWALGLRNVWRFSFDPQTAELWAGDVGQNEREEINLIRKGQNYGWNLYEGTKKYKKNPKIKGPEPLTPPIHEYDHNEGQSITGGYVYYGKRWPSLQGTYIYGDFMNGKIWALKYNEKGVLNNKQIAKSSTISSFGLDENGELFFTSLYNGRIYCLEK